MIVHDVMLPVPPPQSRAGSARVAVLIEVPKVRTARVATARMRACAARWPSKRTRVSYRRRRLRREVRVGGMAILVATVLIGVLMSLVNAFAQTGGLAHWAAYEEPPGVRPPLVSLSPELEAITPAAGPETEAPVVRPLGYLLPEAGDQVTEEQAHAGS